MDGLLDEVGAIVAGIFDNPIVRLAWVGFVAYVVLVWLASAYWVLGDARRRQRDPMLPFLAAGAVILASPVLFPLAVVVYRIVRPGETLVEARERELTERVEALEDDFALACPGCARSVEEDWLLCPACRTRLAHRCLSCGRTMGLDWALCSWCGTEFGRTVLPERLPRPVRKASRERDGDRRQLGEPRPGRPARALGPGDLTGAGELTGAP
jgi:hypothetical protein